MYKYKNLDNGEQIEFTNPEEVALFKMCDTCFGEGQYWDIKPCTKPVPECCGGCGEDKECEDCEGQGWIEIEGF